MFIFLEQLIAFCLVIITVKILPGKNLVAV